MFATLNYWVLFLFVATTAFGDAGILGSSDGFTACRSTDVCVRLTNCLPYVNLIKSLQKPLRPSAIVFLRKQECGFDGLYPMVCCFSTVSSRKPPVNTMSDGPSYGRAEPPVIEPPRKPDLNLIDFSEYTTRRSKGIIDFDESSTAQNAGLVSTTRRRAEGADKDIRKKIDAFNSAFSLSSLDYFDVFARSILNKNANVIVNK